METSNESHRFLRMFLQSGYAIPAINCVSSSGINACLEAARQNDAPVIIQFSSGGSQVSQSTFSTVPVLQYRHSIFPII